MLELWFEGLQEPAAAPDQRFLRRLVKSEIIEGTPSTR